MAADSGSDARRNQHYTLKLSVSSSIGIEVKKPVSLSFTDQRAQLTSPVTAIRFRHCKPDWCLGGAYTKLDGGTNLSEYIRTGIVYQYLNGRCRTESGIGHPVFDIHFVIGCLTLFQATIR